MCRFKSCDEEGEPDVPGRQGRVSPSGNRFDAATKALLGLLTRSFAGHDSAFRSDACAANARLCLIAVALIPLAGFSWSGQPSRTLHRAAPPVGC